MNVTLDVRLEGGTANHLVSYSDTPENVLLWLSGFLCNGLIVDSMKVM